MRACACVFTEKLKIEQLQLNLAKQLIKNVGWPDWFDFSDTSTLDAYHEHYNLIRKMDDWWEIREALQYAYQQTENVGILEKEPNRKNFLMSPAIFNAWYQPNLNSITFPYAAFNPPSYGYGYPKAYNYAGQGSTAGHELTHGFDDEGNIYGINKNKIGNLSKVLLIEYIA
ncbi:unnamed protein product [Gongylonema pulchrum]|uniref:Peptidase_M13 domain-containing protein n=1 Tax=Gongylonema pulchrum TaxID=637853 RepID=A0A183D7V1_9BILA|nr:unnamed protein product [Gongylonema pulchrum]